MRLCKLEIRECYATRKNYRETARVFGLQDSTVRKLCKTAPPKKTNKDRFDSLKGSKLFKGNKKAPGLSLSKKNCFICFNESPLKMMKNLFHLENSLRSQDI